MFRLWQLRKHDRRGGPRRRGGNCGRRHIGDRRRQRARGGRRGRRDGGSRGRQRDGGPRRRDRDGGAGGVAAPAGPRVSDFLGVNGFIDDPTEKLAAVGNVREYHDWSWNDGNGAAGYPGYPNNQLSFSLFSGFWDFDAYYAALDQAGAWCFRASRVRSTTWANAMPPVPAGADVTAPASYVAHASFMYQLAARYGSQGGPDRQAEAGLRPDGPTGTGLLTYYENGNEPDANWVHSDGSYLFSPEATAAMSSADYDGDQGRLGATFGVKNADPTGQDGAGRPGRRRPLGGLADQRHDLPGRDAHLGGGAPGRQLPGRRHQRARLLLRSRSVRHGQSAAGRGARGLRPARPRWPASSPIATSTCRARRSG